MQMQGPNRVFGVLSLSSSSNAIHEIKCKHCFYSTQFFMINATKSNIITSKYQVAEIARKFRLMQAISSLSAATKPICTFVQSHVTSVILLQRTFFLHVNNEVRHRSSFALGSCLIFTNEG